jgi:hypothetical protein
MVGGGGSSKVQTHADGLWCVEARERQASGS